MSSRFFLGNKVSFKNLCYIYPPTVNDVVNNPKYYLYRDIITISQEDIIDENEESFKGKVLSPFKYLMKNMLINKEMAKFVREAFLFFTKEKTLPLYESNAIMFGDITDLVGMESVEDVKLLKEEDFLVFQNLIRESVNIEAMEEYDFEADPRIQEMKAKARYRDKVKSKQGGVSLEAILEALCCMGIGITPLNIGELSYAAAIKIFEACSRKEKYELDIKSLLAGADSKKVKPEHWIKHQS